MLLKLKVTALISLGALILSCNSIEGLPLEYYGARIGALSQYHHGVSGEVYAVDSRTLFIKNFNYDGEGPAAYFYVGNTATPSNNGAWRLRDERGNANPIKRYRNKDITLSLPEGKTLKDITWFSVWCDEFAVNFGHVNIPKNLNFPRPQKIAGLKGIHGVSSDPIVIVDAQTLLIPNFSYDGEAPDAKFWTGRGVKPSPQGIRIPDENGKEVPLRRYDKKTIVLTLPGDITVFDVGHFGVWCEAFTVDFAHVKIPESANVPPSLKMLGISPQSKLNCEVLLDDIAFEVRWAVAGESVVIQLVAKLDENDYMSFGVSPDINKSIMIGSDVAVAWIDRVTGKGFAHDYYLEAKAQCSGNRGSCPDPRLEENTNSIRLLNAAMVNGFSIITYQRPLKASDRFDLPIYSNISQAIVWAIGPLNDRTETSYHNKVLRTTRLINFGRQPTWNCPVPDSDKIFDRGDDSSEEEDDEPTSEKLSQTLTPTADRRGSDTYYSSDKTNSQQGLFEVTPKPKPRPIATPRPAAKEGAWEIPPIQCDEPEDGVFYAQMGPTGGKQGYSAITGHVGWGISIYINGLLIPEINVVRGKTYTFVVETGHDADVPAKYHPFYITDDPIGGFEHKTDEERSSITIFAGAKKLRNGEVVPTGVGRYCYWEPNLDGPPSDDYPSFGAYQRSLTLKCEPGEPGVITWTPDENTPDTVYYHCYSHRYLGWRINVHDSCDSIGQASDKVETYYENYDAIEPAASIRHESKVVPNENYFIESNNKDDAVFKNHNMQEVPPKMDVEISKNTEISKIIAEGIRAAEALEESIAKNTSLLNNQEIYHHHSYPKIPDAGMKLPSHKPPFNAAGIPVFVRQPQGVLVMSNQKSPMRRPLTNEKRPMKLQQNMLQRGVMPQSHGLPPAVKMPPRPFQIPQPSMLINHYKKPMSPMMRPYGKPTSFSNGMGQFLMLGEPSEIKMMKKPLDIRMDMISKGPKPIDLPYNINNKDRIEPMLQMRKEKPVKHEKLAKPEKLPPKISYKPPFEMKKIPSFTATNVQPNDGFKPDSVVIEGGFKPIVRRREDTEESTNERAPLFERREDTHDRDIDHEIDEAIENEGIYIETQTQSKHFEPMFKPSPLDNAVTNPPKAAANVAVEEKLTGDLREMNVEDGEDKMAMAAEQYDRFYLPTDGYPVGAVVTFDGKAVLDSSLVNAAPLNEVKRSSGVSKIELLMRNKPQFGPFRGEIPPLNPDFDDDESLPPIFNNANNKRPVSHHTNPAKKSSEKPISTKLTIVRDSNSKNKTERQKRAAHHHPDHHSTADEHHSTSKASSKHIPHLLVSLFLYRLVMHYLGQ